MTSVDYAIDGAPTGPPIVLSGSLGSDMRMWEPQVRAFSAAGYRVVRYDHRGHGRSPVPPGPYSVADLASDTLALLDRLGIDRAHFVGLSLGGMVGLWLGGNAPERVRTLTLCCTSAQLGPPSLWADRAALVRAEGTAAIAVAAVQRWFTPEWRAADPERTRFYEDMVAAVPAEGYASCCAAIETMDQTALLPTIGAPTLVIAGADDPATPPAHGRRIADAIPHARLEIIDSAAHLATAEQSDLINDLILGHLKENS
ncbi:3-oxoadipate enol-lactonase [Nocardia tenerifensis]|uniref:3-oxoadipate enol-lactonase n=2 Tax=Nocardia tenerifensis TaxID=228006 RepID=A0A318K9D0_9NOCA|nr:3-oxoadipate enol-lactonase [Nocardia tenerifensis]PXX60973.1 3-oxoadipate enol-lactonase [Nocardia tenerifensis]